MYNVFIYTSVVTYMFMSFSHKFSHNIFQVGPAYFKTCRKCQVFGICQEAKSVQVNYLIDEADGIGKGADAVLSLLHHYLDSEHFPEGKNCKEYHVQADNCVGQNKNNANVHYWLWRTMLGLCDSVELNFMIAGHTKFAPDRFFGLIKRRYNKSVVDTLQDLVDIVNTSTTGGYNVAQLTSDPVSGDQYVTWYAWSTFLQQYFKPIDGLTKYHHFRMCASEPGVVYARILATSPEEKFNVLFGDVDHLANPDVIRSAGLSLE